MSLAAHLAAQSEPPVYVTVDAASHQDLDALIAYPSITTVHLKGATNKLDLAPLTQLPALDYLSFSEPRPDLSIVPSLKGLRALHLAGCKLADLGQLAGAGLSLLTTQKTPTTLAPLAALPDLRQLTMLGSASLLADVSLSLDHLILIPKIEDLAPLLGHASLRTLKLAALTSTSSAPLKALERLEHLERLELPGSKLTELDALAALDRLLGLDLTDNKKLRSFKGLSALSRLESLRLTTTPIKKLDLLAGLTNMKELWLSSTKITSILPLAAMRELKTLLVSFSSLATLDGIQGMSALESLDISHSMIRDLSPLKGLPSLVSLSAGGWAPLQGAEVLATLPALRYLHLGNSDVDPALIPAHLNP